MKTNKTPGSDGLPTEFYKQFWVHIKDILLKSLNEAYEKGKLSYSQRRGIIKLLYKKNDKTPLNNWRPISLLNTDYKILAHVLANRLKNVIEKLINTDQTGYIKGRFIGQNIRVIQDVIDLLENNNTEGGILFLDFRKAFDTVNHKFLKKTLEAAKFGSSFIRWIDTMYNNAEACVTNNGWTSKPLFIGRGIRQGCPLSALLFLLVVEVLANKIRKNKEYGIEIELTEDKKEYVQLTQLADDTSIFAKNEFAIIQIVNEVEQFGRVSGLALNKEKTEGLWLGCGKNRMDNLAGLNWNQKEVKALGVYFGYDKKEIEQKNWQTKVDRIKCILKRWSRRDLSFKGRVNIIKCLGLSQINYLLSALCTPKWVLNEVNKEFFSFIWKYKRDKIARKVMINEMQSGGINMIDVKTFNTSMKATWISKLYNGQNEKWTAIPRKLMSKCELKFLLNMNTEMEKQIPINLPQFYKEVIMAWHLSGGGIKAPQNANDYRREMIWGNKYILSKGKTLFYEHWKNSGINFVDNLLTNDGKFKPATEILKLLKNKKNWLIEYNTIINSIPKTWKEDLENNCYSKVKTRIEPFLMTKEYSNITYQIHQKNSINC